MFQRLMFQFARSKWAGLSPVEWAEDLLTVVLTLSMVVWALGAPMI